MHKLRVFHRVSENFLNYLKKTSKKGLKYNLTKSFAYEGYLDACYDVHHGRRKYMSKFYTYLDDSIVTWRSKKKNIIFGIRAEVK